MMTGMSLLDGAQVSWLGQTLRRLLRGDNETNGMVAIVLVGDDDDKVGKHVFSQKEAFACLFVCLSSKDLFMGSVFISLHCSQHNWG